MEDLAIDGDGQVRFAVVAVASFLIDHRLIAVHPDALAMTRRPGRLMLRATTAELAEAGRFADDDWPDGPDLIASSDVEPLLPETVSEAGQPADAASPPSSGSATITGAGRQATLSAGERSISQAPRVIERSSARSLPPIEPVASVSSSAASGAKFAQLDDNGDGFLDRSEIATEMTFRDRYTRLDLDANDLIDSDEFAVFMETRPRD